MEEWGRFDPLQFVIHFVFGLLVGAVLGMRFWVGWYEDLPGIICIGGCALLVGLAGGICGDRFWKRFLEGTSRLWWWL